MLAPPEAKSYVDGMRPTSCVSFAIITGILVSVIGCDKSKSAAPAAEVITPFGATALDLRTKPQLLFQVFGDISDPRVIPIAAVINGNVRQIGLTRSGWHALDSMYFAAGSSYPAYRNDAEAGQITITRGMWNGGDTPLYPLPGCKDLVPLASSTVTLSGKTNEPTVEFIASSAALVPHPPFTGQMPSGAEIAKMGRAFGHEIGKKSEMDAAELDSLDFVARMLITGASSSPTLLVSFIDPNAGDLGPGMGHTSHLFALMDKQPDGSYAPTYRHTVSGDAKTVEFQRLIDHIDVNGDGVDELILEAWKYGAPNELVVLSFKAGLWHESLRVKQSWCLDPVKPKQ
jgi:hypothetical protein